MKVSVQLFARAKDLAGSDTVEVELAEGATLAELRQRLNCALPLLTELLRRSALAVDGEFAEDHALLHEGAEVAMIPPVSGGAW